MRKVILILAAALMGVSLNSIQAQSGKKLEPSAEAKANDPKAGDPTVIEGYSKSIGEIHAFYEQLDPEVYMTPYWKYKDFYVDEGNKEHDNNLFYIEYKSHEVMNLRDAYSYMKIVHPITKKEGNVPLHALVINAYFALFAADPDSYTAYQQFLRASALYEGARIGGLDPKKTNGGIDDNEGMLITNSDWLDIWRNEHSRLDKLVDNLDFDVLIQIGDGLIGAVDHYLKIKKYPDAVKFTRILGRLSENLEYHPKKTETADYKRVQATYKKYEEMSRLEWVDKCMPAIVLPKTYPMPEKIVTAALTDAREQFKGVFEIEKLVFLSTEWRTFTNPKHPYNVTHRSLLVGFISKEDDRYVIRRYNLQQPGDGTSWRAMYNFTAVFGREHLPHPLIDYKP